MKIVELLEGLHNFTSDQLRQIERKLGGDTEIRDVRRNVNSYSAAIVKDGKRQTIEFTCKVVGKNIEGFKQIS